MPWEYLQESCNKYVNGFCSTRVCLVRGGWSLENRLKLSHEEWLARASCENHEIIQDLEELDRLREEKHD